MKGGKCARRLLFITLVLLGGVILAGASGYGAPMMAAEQDCLHCHDRETIFDGWAMSSHRQLDCLSCHGSEGMLQRLGDRVESATRQVRFAVGADVTAPEDVCRVTDETCLGCHRDPAAGEDGKLRVRPAHALHLTELGVGCMECHAPVVHIPSVEEAETTRMDQCIDCHEAEGAVLLVAGEVPTTSCLDCHADNVEPADHQDEDWREGHAAASAKQDCTHCHRFSADATTGVDLGLTAGEQTGDFCLDCHRVALPHDAAWLARHGEALQEDPSVCLACHETGSSTEDPVAALLAGESCRNCHTTGLPHPEGFLRSHGRTGLNLNTCEACHSSANWITPKADYADDDFCTECHLTQNPHPGSWVALHGAAVEDRGLDSCLTCHDEQRDCQSCHTGTSWHPAGWVLLHGREALKQGLEDCQQCHTDPQECTTCHTPRRPQQP